MSIKFCFCLLGFFITAPNFHHILALPCKLEVAELWWLSWICSSSHVHNSREALSGAVQSTSQPIHLSAFNWQVASVCKQAPGIHLGSSLAQLCAWGRQGWWSLLVAACSGLLSLPFSSYKLRFRNSQTKTAQNMQMGKGLPSLPAAWNGICKVSSFLFMEAFGLYASVRTGMNFKHVSTEHN